MTEERIHQVFAISVLLKGAHAVLECIGGIALGVVTTQSIADLVDLITQEELTEDPNDFVATQLLRMAQGFTADAQRFYAFYLLSHGVIKLLLVIGLLRRKLWAYPVSLVVFALFVLYQLYRYSYTHGIGLIGLTILDLIVMGLVWHEYRLLRRHWAAR